MSRQSFYLISLIVVFACGAYVPHVLAIDSPFWGTNVTCNATSTPCTVCDGMKVAINVIDFMTIVAFPLAAAVIVYGGFLILTSAGSEDRVRTGLGAIQYAVVGILLVLGGWLIIKTLIHAFAGDTGSLQEAWTNLTTKNLQCSFSSTSGS